MLAGIGFPKIDGFTYTKDASVQNCALGKIRGSYLVSPTGLAACTWGFLFEIFGIRILAYFCAGSLNNIGRVL